MKYFIITILLIFCTLFVQADIISGRVIDTDTRETLPGATVQYLTRWAASRSISMDGLS